MNNAFSLMFHPISNGVLFDWLKELTIDRARQQIVEKTNAAIKRERKYL